MADVFGLFGKYNVYFSSYWGPLVSYVASAYKIYRNYDGSKSTFGDISCKVTVSNTAAASVYASNDSHDSTKLHVIIINKEFAGQPALHITIHSQKQFSTGDAYSLNSDNANIAHEKKLYELAKNALTITAQPQTIYHFVFEMKPNAGVAVPKQTALLECTNNVSGNVAIIHYHVSSPAFICIIDMQGRIIRSYERLHDGGTIEFSGASGVYEVSLNDGTHVEHRKIWITH
jgi:hypothetical protein